MTEIQFSEFVKNNKVKEIIDCSNGKFTILFINNEKIEIKAKKLESEDSVIVYERYFDNVKLNIFPKPNDIIKIEKKQCTGVHCIGDIHIVEKAKIIDGYIVIKTTRGRIIKSLNYSWSICDIEPQIKSEIPINYINPDINTLPDVDIYDMGLRVRAYNVLCVNKIKTLHSLVKLKKHEILRFRYLGRTSVQEIIENVFNNYGFLIK